MSGRRIAAFVLLFSLSFAASGATFTVTSTADAGAGTLRDAIIQANAAPGADLIEFNIPGAGVHVIQLASQLPAISDSVHIDGATQPGYVAHPVILLESNTRILLLDASNSTVSALALSAYVNPYSAIYIGGTGGHTIRGCYVGTDAQGTTDTTMAATGIQVSSSGNTIGGSTPADRNIIGGNSSGGIRLNAPGNTVCGNYIGIGADGHAAIPNGVGIEVFADNNAVGGNTAAQRNVISGNTREAVLCFNNGNVITGNYIGVSADGTYGVPNRTGIYLGGSDNVVGGSSEGERNVIAASQMHGASIAGPRNRIIGNYIGTNGDATQAIPNATGVSLASSATDTVIGGRLPGERNIISGNDTGINSVGATGNSIIGNYIGVGADGAQPIPNGYGIILGYGTAGTMIGGVLPGEGNVITANLNWGIYAGPEISECSILGNYIGLDASGTAFVEAYCGISLYQSTNMVIGGTSPGARNYICASSFPLWLYDTVGTLVKGNTFNMNKNGVPCVYTSVGVEIIGASMLNEIGGMEPGAGNEFAPGSPTVRLSSTAFFNPILGNSYGRSSFPIDLSDSMHTPNDVGDLDTGANDLQNYPVISSVTSDDTGTTIAGSLNSTSNSLFRLEFLRSSGANSPATMLEVLNVATDSAGNSSFSLFTGQRLAVGDLVIGSATNLDTSNTSEFSLGTAAAVDAPGLDCPTDTVHFGKAVVGGAPGATRTIRIVNIGTKPLIFTGVGLEITGTHPADFQFLTTDTSPLAPSNSRDISVLFAATALGVRDAQLSITTNDPGKPAVAVPLTGTGVTSIQTTYGRYTGDGPGISTIGVGGDYPTIAEAALDMEETNLDGGDWTFLIISDIEETSRAMIVLNTNNNNVTFRPAPGKTVTLDYSNCGDWYYFSIFSNLYDGYKTHNIIIDGCNTPGGIARDLTMIGAQLPSTNPCFVICDGDHRNIQIRNCVMHSRFTGGGPYTVGNIDFRHTHYPESDVTGIMSRDCIVENCVLTNQNRYNSAISCILQRDVPTTAPQSGMTGMVFRNNIIESKGRAIFLSGVQEVDVTSNTIRHEQTGTALNGCGVFIWDATWPINNMRINVENNNFEQVNAWTNASTIFASAILIDSGGTGDIYNIRNNMIGGIGFMRTSASSAAGLHGIRFARNNNATLNIEHNSINMLAAPGTYTGLTATNTFGIGILGSSFGGTANITNNIIRVAQPGGACIALGSGGTVNCDHNVLYAGPGCVIGNKLTTSCPTLAQWQTVSGKDANSVVADPTVAAAGAIGKWARPTASSSNLHFTAGPGASYVVPFQPGLALDIDGDMRSTLSTIAGADQPIDSDGDGVTDVVEDMAVTGGDSNGDGTMDSLQANVASLPDLTGTKRVTFVCEAGLQLVNVQAMANPSPSDMPSGWAFPLGFFRFEVTGLVPGASATVEMLLPSDVRVTHFYKYGMLGSGSSAQWYPFPLANGTGAEVDNSRIVLHFRDGARGDDDITANGRIVDPGAPALGVSTAASDWNLY